MTTNIVWYFIKTKSLLLWSRGVFSYVKRVTQKNGKAEFAAKFISARGKRKALALREMDLLSELENERILYFYDAFEKKNVVVLITELYPFTVFWMSCSTKGHIFRRIQIQPINTNVLLGPLEAQMKWSRAFSSLTHPWWGELNRARMCGSFVHL